MPSLELETRGCKGYVYVTVIESSDRWERRKYVQWKALCEAGLHISSEKNGKLGMKKAEALNNSM
jgi:hypothetical protein